MLRRSRRAALLVAVVSLALALAAAELVVRAAGVAPEVSPVRRGRIQLSTNPRLVFEPVPALAVAEAGLWDGWPGAANRLGYRDRDHPVDKPAGTFRIVVLGDSIAEGLGIDDSEAIFPALLEDRLAAAGRPVEVLNFAVTGYNTAQEVETLAARALAFEPDLVLLAYCLNDRRPPDPRLVAALSEEAARPGAVAPAALGGVKRVLLGSALFRLAWLRLATTPEVALPPGIDPEAPPPRPHQIAERYEDGRPVAGPAAVEAAFERLAGIAADAAAAGHGFEVAVVVFPYFERLFHAPYADHHGHVEGLAARHGFAFLDLGPAMRECQRESEEPVAYDRYHPTAAGHACAAEAIGGFLVREGMVPTVESSSDKSKQRATTAPDAGSPQSSRRISMTLAPYAPPAEALAARTEANLPRNPFVAAALSILVPGAGQLYNGRFVRGAIVYSAMLLLVLLLRGGFLAQDAWELLGVLSILLVVHLAAAVGASVWGLRHGSTRHRLVHRWFLFVPLVVALAILPWTAPAPLASQRPMKIPFRSMQPTIRPGELVLVDWTYYHHHAPQRGDLAVFRSPHDEKRLLKRVIGLAGERIETSGGRATVEGDAAADRWAYLDGPSLDLSFSGVVPEGAVFVLGDFRHNSRDSRSFGYVSDGRLVGRAISIYASEDPNRIGLLLED